MSIATAFTPRIVSRPLVTNEEKDLDENPLEESLLGYSEFIPIPHTVQGTRNFKIKEVYNGKPGIAKIKKNSRKIFYCHSKQADNSSRFSSYRKGRTINLNEEFSLGPSELSDEICNSNVSTSGSQESLKYNNGKSIHERIKVTDQINI